MQLDVAIVGNVRLIVCLVFVDGFAAKSKSWKRESPPPQTVVPPCRRTIFPVTIPRNRPDWAKPCVWCLRWLLLVLDWVFQDARAPAVQICFLRGYGEGILAWTVFYRFCPGFFPDFFPDFLPFFFKFFCRFFSRFFFPVFWKGFFSGAILASPVFVPVFFQVFFPVFPGCFFEEVSGETLRKKLPKK